MTINGEKNALLKIKKAHYISFRGVKNDCEKKKLNLYIIRE